MINFRVIFDLNMFKYLWECTMGMTELARDPRFYRTSGLGDGELRRVSWCGRILVLCSGFAAAPALLMVLLWPQTYLGPHENMTTTAQALMFPVIIAVSPLVCMRAHTFRKACEHSVIVLSILTFLGMLIMGLSVVCSIVFGIAFGGEGEFLWVVTFALGLMVVCIALPAGTISFLAWTASNSITFRHRFGLCVSGIAFAGVTLALWAGFTYF